MPGFLDARQAFEQYFWKAMLSRALDVLLNIHEIRLCVQRDYPGALWSFFCNIFFGRGAGEQKCPGDLIMFGGHVQLPTFNSAHDNFTDVSRHNVWTKF